MQNPVRINSLDVENVKRIQAVRLDCSGQSLTVIGGDNAQGKTSLLDAIMWALGGDRYRPSKALREGEEKLSITIELSNGLTVERKGCNGALKVNDSTGKKGGQQLLNEFVSQMALDLPRFMEITAKEKAHMLLDEFPGLGLRLEQLSQEVKRLYDERHALGQIVVRKQKHADDLPFHPDVPEKPLTGSEMTTKMQEAMQINARNTEVRRRRDELLRNRQQAESDLAKQDERIAELETRLSEERHRRTEISERVRDLDTLCWQAQDSVQDLQDADTTETQRALEQIDSINAKVRQNMDKERAADEARELRDQYQALSVEIEKVRAERVRLLSSVKMPLDGLMIDEDGELIYANQKWDCMSGAEQLRVAVAICAAIKPECGFVLLDGLERMDIGQLREFAAWLAERNLQAIGTRVSTGDECSIIIEDGSSVIPDAQASSKTTPYDFE